VIRGRLSVEHVTSFHVDNFEALSERGSLFLAPDYPACKEQIQTRIIKEGQRKRSELQARLSACLLSVLNGNLVWIVTHSLTTPSQSSPHASHSNDSMKRQDPFYRYGNGCILYSTPLWSSLRSSYLVLIRGVGNLTFVSPV
jgi:hypothetical protein